MVLNDTPSPEGLSHASSSLWDSPPAGSDTVTSDGGSHPADDHGAPLDLDPPPVDPLGGFNFPIEAVNTGFEGAPTDHPPLGNSTLLYVGAWTWSEVADAPDVFQNIAVQGLIDPAASPEQFPLPQSSTQTQGYTLLPLEHPATRSSSVDANFDEQSNPQTTSEPDVDTQYPWHLVLDLEGDIRGVGEGLPLDADRLPQGDLSPPPN